MDRLWLDRETSHLLVDEYVVEMESYRWIVGDETMTEAELDGHTRRVVSLLRQLE
jgi:hypothetical protein